VCVCVCACACDQLVDRSTNLTLLRNAIWLATNLCRGKPAPDFDIVSGFVRVFAMHLNSDDSEVCVRAHLHMRVCV
jgi:importin subunit alpha-1